MSTASKTDRQSTLRPGCPAGKTDCCVIDELLQMRQTVAELSQQVRTDQLTGLYNYRYFCSALEQELERTRRSGYPTTLIMIDIDHFKQVNDRWGHEVGNRALVHIAMLIRQTVRMLDIPCRYGGEEFAIVLPNTGLETAAQAAERLRSSLEKSPLDLEENGQLQLTASFGLASYQLGDELPPEELVEKADHYLYQAKQQGRNQICHPELPVSEIVSQDEREALFDLFGKRTPDNNESE